MAIGKPPPKGVTLTQQRVDRPTYEMAFVCQIVVTPWCADERESLPAPWHRLLNHVQHARGLPERSVPKHTGEWPCLSTVKRLN